MIGAVALFLDTNAISIYLSFRQFCEHKSIELEHINYSENQSFNRIGQILHCSIYDNNCKDIYITPVKNEEEVEMLKMYLNRFFSSCLPLPNLDMRPLEILFFELFMNICQHSFDNNGFVFIPYQESGEIRLICSDFGVGIAQKIKDFYKDKDFQSDAHAIKYATQDLVSTQTTTHNKGRGLNTLLSNVENYDAVLEIVCNKGKFVLKEGNIYLEELPYFHQGTLVSIIFDVNKFNHKELANYENEIDF